MIAVVFGSLSNRHRPRFSEIGCGDLRRNDERYVLNQLLNAEHGTTYSVSVAVFEIAAQIGPV